MDNRLRVLSSEAPRQAATGEAGGEVSETAEWCPQCNSLNRRRNYAEPCLHPWHDAPAPQPQPSPHSRPSSSHSEGVSGAQAEWEFEAATDAYFQCVVDGMERGDTDIVAARNRLQTAYARAVEAARREGKVEGAENSAEQALHRIADVLERRAEREK